MFLNRPQDKCGGKFIFRQQKKIASLSSRRAGPAVIIIKRAREMRGMVRERESEREAVSAGNNNNTNSEETTATKKKTI